MTFPVHVLKHCPSYSGPTLWRCFIGFNKVLVVYLFPLSLKPTQLYFHTHIRTHTHTNEVQLQIAVWLAKTCGMTPYKCVFRRRIIGGHCTLVVVIFVSLECESMKTMLLLMVEQNATVTQQSFRGALIHFVLWRISAVFWSISCFRAAPTVVTQL